MSRIVSLVLAARPGDIHGDPPWLEAWGAGTLVDAVLGDVRTWPVEPGVVVLGMDAEEMLEGADLDRFTIVVDPEWGEGEAATLRAGVDELTRWPDVVAFVLTSADIPGIPPDVVGDLLEAHGTHERFVTAPKYRYARGMPIVVRRELWPRLLGLEGDTGIDGLLQAHAGWVHEVWVDALPPRPVTSARDLAERRPRH